MSGYFPADFISGAITLGYLVLGLYFMRFWQRTRDSLFANFAAAFWLLALNQTAATLSGNGEIEKGWVYLIRLAAFLIIIAAIVRKNIKSSGRS